MRTNIVLDDKLIKEASKLTGITVKKDLVHEALRMLIKSKKRVNINELVGKIKFVDGYDHKKLRS
jgi:Arc/MetJ family transcription regulator